MSSRKAIYTKFRDADDVPGNLAWAATMSKKSLVFANIKPDAFESECALEDNDERLLCQLLRIPRRYMDLENVNFASAERVRAVVRAMISTDAIDVHDFEAGKPILPVEVNRIARKLSGDAPAKKKKSPGLKARVYRPEVGIEVPKPSRPVAAPTAKQKSAAFLRPSQKMQVSAADLKLKSEIEKQHRSIKDTDYYQFLGIGRSANDKEVHSAFVDRAKRWHPDRVSASALADDAKLKTCASELFQHLQKIERTLKDADTRADYDRRLGASLGEFEIRPAEARAALQKAKVFERTRDFSKAKQFYQMAMDFDPSLHEACVAFAWLTFTDEALSKSDRTQKARSLLEPLADDERVADAAYRLALIARTENKESEIQMRIDQAVKYDAKHKEAVQEKRILDRRKAKAPKKGDAKDASKKGLFGFGKK